LDDNNDDQESCCMAANTIECCVVEHLLPRIRSLVAAANNNIQLQQALPLNGGLTLDRTGPI
jgi:hypothetical protein